MSFSEVLSISTPDQFTSGYTAYACGFVSVHSLTSMAPVGHTPTKSASTIIQLAMESYAAYNGDNSPSNDWGMSLPQLYQLLSSCGLHYQGLPLNMDNIRGWITLGYPVILAVEETCVYDIGLGGAVPYPWQPTGSHVIVATGREGQHLICHDSANIEAPNTLRQQPRKYDGNRLGQGLVSATVVVPPWKSRPKSADPSKEQIAPTPKPSSSKTPKGWTDDGTTLKAPNGFKVVHGFRSFVLNNTWNPQNLPIENEVALDNLEVGNPKIGKGTRQAFLFDVLEWTASKGVFKMWVGQELLNLRKDLDQARALPVGPLQGALSPETVQLLISTCSAIQQVLKGN